MFSHCFPSFLFYFYCGPPHFTLVSFLTPLFWGRNRYVRSVDEKWTSGTHAVFVLRRFIALFTALTASSSTLTADGLDLGRSRNASKTKANRKFRRDKFTRCHSYFCWISSLVVQFPSISVFWLQTLQLWFACAALPSACRASNVLCVCFTAAAVLCSLFSFED